MILNKRSVVNIKELCKEKRNYKPMSIFFLVKKIYIIKRLMRAIKSWTKIKIKRKTVINQLLMIHNLN